MLILVFEDDRLKHNESSTFIVRHEPVALCRERKIKYLSNEREGSAGAAARYRPKRIDN